MRGSAAHSWGKNQQDNADANDTCVGTKVKGILGSDPEVLLPLGLFEEDPRLVRDLCVSDSEYDERDVWGMFK